MSANYSGGKESGTGFKLRKIPIASDSGESAPEEAPTPRGGDLEHLGELPHSYGSDTLFLIAQEPRWLFTYWDIDISRHPGGQAHLRVYSESEELEAEIEVPFETRNWYIPVQHPGATYTVEIGYYRGQTWKPIARSAPVKTPPDKISESESFEYASIPLHLSFQRLTETIQAAIRSGESLMHAISRIQQATNHAPGLAQALADGTLGPRMILESLLGSELIEELTSGTFSSEEIEKRISDHLAITLSSAGAAGSEALSSEILQFSSLSSLGILPMRPIGPESSWNVASLSSWAAGALSSWMESAGAGASWAAASSWSTASLSSWGEQTISSWNQASLSSWNISSLSSWIQAVQSSWFQAAQTSWATAALSSWNQAALTSWSQAAVTSWGAASETLSSFGQSGRSFYMHVNAEVIFYGGTDPRAKVTIDGQPVQLNPDGSFRYHFIFPDGKYEIPIVAVSPDGVETRSALLRFERGTTKTGKVDDTAQPPLTAPMGAQP